MKFNWGTGIVIVIILFVIGIGSLVYISMKQQINLVYKDYYPQELKHQTQIDKRNNSLLLKENIKIDYINDAIELNFPHFFRFDRVQGDILLYRPSDFRKDVIVKIKLDEKGFQQIPTTSLDKGKYTVKVDWTHEGIPYFFEQDVHIK